MNEVKLNRLSLVAQFFQRHIQSLQFFLNLVQAPIQYKRVLSIA